MEVTEADKKQHVFDFINDQIKELEECIQKNGNECTKSQQLMLTGYRAQMMEMVELRMPPKIKLNANWNVKEGHPRFKSGTSIFHDQNIDMHPYDLCSVVAREPSKSDQALDMLQKYLHQMVDIKFGYAFIEIELSESDRRFMADMQELKEATDKIIFESLRIPAELCKPQLNNENNFLKTRIR